MAVIRYTNTIKALWEKYLRVIFSADITPKEYRYNSDERKSKIRIYKETPNRVYNVPMITISAGNGDASLRYLGQEVVKQVNKVYNECIQNDKVRYKILNGSLENVYTLNPIYENGEVSYQVINYNVGSDFEFNYTTGIFTWNEGVKPDLYYATYTTFDDGTPTTPIISEYKIKGDTPTQLEFNATSSGLTEVYNYIVDPNDNTKFIKQYFNKQEVYITPNDRTLVWNIEEPNNYFVSYIANRSDCIYTGDFVQAPLNVEIKFEVFARSSQDRERITDLLVLYIRHVVKPELIKYFTYSGENVSGESQEMFDNKVIYKNTVTVPCVTNYSFYIDKSIYALIKNIPVELDVEESNG